jgi:hypothetical protein
MEQSIFTISIPLYSVRGTLQIKLEESFREWKQRKSSIILLLLTMATKRTIATFTRYELDYNFYVSGIPP